MLKSPCGRQASLTERCPLLLGDLKAGCKKQQQTAVIEAASPWVQTRFLEFFTVNIRNRRTRRRAGPATRFQKG
jgi:hypothetical protein